jgi:hypothetical protein
MEKIAISYGIVVVMLILSIGFISIGSMMSVFGQSDNVSSEPRLTSLI